MWGGKGNDVFIYYNGDGSDTIVNYESDVDKIMVFNAVVNPPSVDEAGDVTFRIGSGQIVVEGASNQYIEIVDGVGNQLKVYNP